MKFVSAKVVKVVDCVACGSWCFTEGKEYKVDRRLEYIVDDNGLHCYLMQKGKRVYAPGLEHSLKLEIVK